MARRSAEPITAEISAVLSPIRSVKLAAEVGGRVLAVPAEEHEPVAEGAVLLEFERTFLEAALERARAQLLRAQAGHGLATTELERQRDLAERHVASTADLDRAKNQERAAFAALLDARAAISDAPRQTPSPSCSRTHSSAARSPASIMIPSARGDSRSLTSSSSIIS